MRFPLFSPQTLARKAGIALALAASLMMASSAWAGASEQALYTFGGSNGWLPQSRLIYTKSGAIIGSASFGGNTTTCPNSNGCGVVFEMSAPNNGARDYHVLYAFTGGDNDGEGPIGNMVFDSAGNLYGVTEYGGSSLLDGGTVYKLSPAGNGTWTETILHIFAGGADGLFPQSGLTIDSAGNLYGTATAGGSATGGVVYELTPSSSGTWTETILHTFDYAGGNDGAAPAGEVLLDAAGNIYGTTTRGGTYDYGTAYELSPSSEGYTETILHSFTGLKDEGYPGYSLWMDSVGNLYGVCGQGNRIFAPYGAVFELVHNSNGSWTEKTIHTFTPYYNLDGEYPSSGLTPDAAGNLYGTTYWGGPQNGGVLYVLQPKSGGTWGYRILYSFNGEVQNPGSGITIGAEHTLLGVTDDSANPDTGNVFEITLQ